MSSAIRTQPEIRKPMRDEELANTRCFGYLFPSMLQNRTWPLPGLWAAAAVLLLSACGSRPASSPNPTQPLDELRARELIARALRDEKADSELGRSISVGGGMSLAVDVGVAGKRHGIAYVTESERANLGALIPAHDVGSQALRVVRDQAAPETVILLLHDAAYLADDQAGSDREVTGVMAARKLQRDVKDFLVQARAQWWR